MGFLSDEILKRIFEESEDALTGPELEVSNPNLLHGGAFRSLVFLGNDEKTKVGSV
jgi:hypothetical protein